MNVFCVKFGTKYGADYVNKLYNGVSRNLKSIPFTFYCLTEDAAGLDEGVKTIPLDTSLSGWWAKAHIFKAGTEYGIQGRVMYIDLDMIITGTLENMAKYTGVSQCQFRISLYCRLKKYTAKQLKKWDTTPQSFCSLPQLVPISTRCFRLGRSFSLSSLYALTTFYK